MPIRITSPEGRGLCIVQVATGKDNSSCSSEIFGHQAFIQKILNWEWLQYFGYLSKKYLKTNGYVEACWCSVSVIVPEKITLPWGLRVCIVRMAIGKGYLPLFEWRIWDTRPCVLNILNWKWLAMFWLFKEIISVTELQ